MKILPNGNVSITNGDTGETREVSPGDLPRYGVPFSTYQALSNSGADQELKQIALQQAKLNLKQDSSVNQPVNVAQYAPAKKTSSMPVMPTNTPQTTSTAPTVGSFDREAAKKAGYTDKEIDSYLKTQQTNSATNTTTAQPAKKVAAMPTKTKPSLGDNAVSDVKNIAKALLTPHDLTGGAKNLGEMFTKGAASNIKQFVSDAGLNVLKEYGDLIQHPAQHAFEHPVNTALDVLPFLPKVKGMVAGKTAGETTMTLKVDPKVANRIMQTSSADVADVIAAKGKTPSEYMKYVKKGSSYDDMLGPVAEKNNGGYINTHLKDAESQIQSFANTQTGKTLKIYASDITPQIDEQIAQLSSVTGNEAKIAALNEAKAAIQKSYAKGRGLGDTLKTLRYGNSKFGENAALTQKEAAAQAAQKIEVNAVRSWLKQFNPIKDALQTQEDLLTMKPILADARANFENTGVLKNPNQGNLLKRTVNKVPVVGTPLTTLFDWVDTIKFGTPEKATSQLGSVGPIQGAKNAVNSGRNAVVGMMPEIPQSPNLMAGPLLSASSLPFQQPVDKSQTQGNYPQDSSANNQNGDNINSQDNHTNNYITGYSPEELVQMRMSANQKGDEKGASELEKLYKVETDYQTYSVKGKSPGKKITDNSLVGIQKMKDLYGLGTENTLSQGSTTGFGGVLSGMGQAYKNKMDQTFNDRLTAYKNVTSFAAGLLNQARGAGVLNAGEYEVMLKNMPTEHTSEKQAASWFSNIEDVIKRMDPVQQNITLPQQ